VEGFYDRGSAADQQTSRPADQQTSRPADQQTSRPADQLRILIACERSGVVREAFRRLGHDAWSCDLEPAEDGSPYHIQGDAIEAAYNLNKDGTSPWDMMVAHPECRYLCVSGIHWNNRKRGWENTERAVAFFMQLANAPIPRIAIENPLSIMSTRWRKRDQQIQPYEFGEDASKLTCLWLKNLPHIPIDPSKRFPGRWVKSKSGKLVERWSNQTDGGDNRLPPGANRSMDRARTYPLVAEAWANAWGYPQRDTWA